MLGFVKIVEIPIGEFRWVTARSPEGGNAKLSLEPNANPAGKAFQQAMFAQGIPMTAFEVDDNVSEHARLDKLGVSFTREPTTAGPVKIEVFSDTGGNLIQIYQMMA